MTFCSGPFTIEPVGENPYLCGYKVWLTSKPEKIWEFANGREMGEWVEQVCSSPRTGCSTHE